MKDILSFIPPEHIARDKSYSNIAEYALNVDVLKNYIRLSNKNTNFSVEKCSDYDIFRTFVECLRKNGDTSSRAYLYFDRVMRSALGVNADKVISGDVDGIWRESAAMLLKRENAVKNIIARSEFDSIGIATAPWENAVLPEKIGDTEIKGLICPIGVRGRSILDVKAFKSFDELCESIKGSTKNDCAVLLGELDFEFEKPNLYVASAAYDKYSKGQSLKNSELNILKTQLLREVFFGASASDSEISLVLSTAENVKKMYQTEQLLDYIDASLDKGVKITLFAGDAVGFAFAVATAEKPYKKITAEAAICGNDCHFISDDEAKYWGVGSLPEKKASLATTPAYIAQLL